MAIFKNKDIATDIRVTDVNVGNIGAKFYSEDENTASIGIYIKNNGQVLDLSTITMKPLLNLYAEDGSVFLDEPLTVENATEGFIKYYVSPEIVKHVGRMNAKLFLESPTESVHIANFSFDIGDSGTEKNVAKVIDVDILGDKILEIMKENVALFKGEKGDTGEQGIQGEQGEKGDKGDKGDDVIVDGYVSSADQLPAGNTQSIYLVGSQLYYRNAGQTNWSAGKDIKSQVTVKDGFFYIDGVKTTATANESQAIEYSKQYVQSRGQNLVTNGTGLLGDNTNFPQMIYKTDDVKVGQASFYSNKLNGINFTNEFIPVDTSKKYQMSLWGKSKNGIGIQHGGFQCFDIDRNEIFYDHYQTDGINTPVSLTQPLKVGDTKVYVSDVSQWLETTGVWNSTPMTSRGVILWGYKNNGGYQYPDNTYSRYSQRGISSVDATENSITLSSPWREPFKDSSDGSFPTGHKLNRIRGAQTYQYTLYSSVKFPTTWTFYQRVFGGSETGMTADDFRPGTALVKPIFLTNYGTQDETWLSGIEFKEVSDNSVKWTDAVLQNGFTGSVKYYKDINSLVTVQFDITAGSTIAMHTIVASIPTTHLPVANYIPIPAFNLSAKNFGINFNIGNGYRAFTVGSEVVAGHRYAGQITYRVG